MNDERVEADCRDQDATGLPARSPPALSGDTVPTTRARIRRAPPAPDLAARDAARDYVLSILDRELKLTLAGVELGSQRDKSMRELTRTAATLYEGRILRELIQNAYDGSGRHEGADILLRLDLSGGSAGVVDVANTGQGFQRENVDAIVNPALSSKRPGNSIGHKGLGFRSVELVSDDPQIYSSAGGGRPGLAEFDGYCFRFADEAAQLERLGEISDSESIAEASGRTHKLQLPLPIDRQDETAATFAQSGFASLVRLPLKDELATRRMREELDGLFTSKAPLALFLDRLSKLTIEAIGPDGAVERRTISRTRRRHAELDGLEFLAVDVVITEGRRYLVARREVDRDRFMAAVQAAIDEQFPVEKWLEWEGAPSVSVAFGLDADAPGGPYYAFLPMEQEAPFHGFVDGPFYPDPDRRGLSLANPLNATLLDVAAEMCLSLGEAISSVNATTPDLVNVAVDAIAWRQEARRVFEALDRKGGERGAIMLPAMRQAAEATRWARVDEIFEWPDDSHRAIKASWITKACGIPFLRRNLGARRTERLVEFAAEAGYTLDPWPDLLAGWIPMLAQDLSRRRAATRQDWEAFYHDVSRMTDVLPELHRRTLFRGTDGKLVNANAEDGSGSQFFIVAQQAVGRRGRRRLSGGDRPPPPGITKNMTFADPTLDWPTEVTAAFVGAKLASEFSLVKVLGSLGTLLGDKPTAKRQAAALTWAFSSWKDNRRPEIEAALSRSKLRVPVTGGQLEPAGRARFSRNWRNTAGDRLADYCDAVAGRSRLVARLKEQLLPDWETWSADNPGAAADWTEFLRHVGVRDGLAPVSIAAEEHGAWFWQAFRDGRPERQAFENTTGSEWRSAVSASKEWFRYSTKTYSSTNTMWVLPGQSFYAEFTASTKHAFAQLVIAMLRESPAEWFSTVLKKTDGNWDTVTWPSPMTAFLRLAAWLPLAGADEFEGARPRDVWFAPKADLPRFIRRMDRGIRDQVESSPGLQKILAGRLGMPLWAEPAQAAAKIAALGRSFGDVSESEHDSFRKAYREAWLQWAEAEKRVELPETLTLVIETGGRLTPLALAGKGDDHGTIHAADGASPMIEQLLAALGSRVLHLPSAAVDAAAAAIKASTGATMVRVDPASLRVTVDGEEFAPSDSAPLLIPPGREWLAELSVLVLELNSPLTSRNTARARQALHDAVRRVRLAPAGRIEVALGGDRGPLPGELQGVLPVLDPDHPTLIAERASGEPDWPLLARLAGPLALAIGRADLGDAFRLAFMALEASARDAGATTLARPGDEAVARALGRPVQRIRELYRSLRSTMDRLLDHLVPVAHALLGGEAAEDLLDRAERPMDDGDVHMVLQRHGMPAAEVSRLLAACRDAEGLNEVRRALGIDLATFNRSLAVLSPRWTPLDFDETLRRSFLARVAERRTELERVVRDAFLPTYDARRPLGAYVDDLKLGWLAAPAEWSGQFDEVSEETVDAAIDAQCRSRFGPGSDTVLADVEEVRQANRATLGSALDRLRAVVRAWLAKAPAEQGPDWALPSDQLMRKAVAAGVLDFRTVAAETLPAVLSQASIWPAGMPATTDLQTLGMTEADLQSERREQERREQEKLVERRSIKFGTVEVDGGSARPFDAVAEALSRAFADGGFKARSGRADLAAFEAGTLPKQTRKRGGGKAETDPSYLSEEQRSLIGFAGELAAFHYLKLTQRNFSEDYWVSSMGRRYLGRSVGLDDDGFDFRIPRFRGEVCFEVKAHTGDPGYVDLERSQVLAAASMAQEVGSRRWGILYVTNVDDPARVAVHELPNPYSAAGAPFFRERLRSGVRLMIQRR